jgi:hypothetical protein
MPAKYEFYYFNGHGLGIIPRLLLSLGGFDWKDKFVEVSFIHYHALIHRSIQLTPLLELEGRKRKDTFHPCPCIDRV